jgi:hypothetical protein
MFALSWAMFAAVGAACGRHCKFNLGASTAIVAAGLVSVCLSAAVADAGDDPADPTAKVASVRYRSTIAPYMSLRPSTPAPWRERNESVAPQRKPTDGSAR